MELSKLLLEHLYKIGNAPSRDLEEAQKIDTSNDSFNKFLGCVFAGKKRDNISFNFLKLIQSYDSCLDYLINTNFSLSRFGDGEFRVISGESHDFNDINIKLKNKLIQTLRYPHEKCALGLVSTLFRSRLPNEYWERVSRKCKPIIIENINFDRVYLNANMTLVFAKQSNHWDRYFAKFRSIWNRENIILVANFDQLDTYKYNIFDNAAKIIKINAPARNAFAEYDELIQQISLHDRSNIIILILGMTATVMANDLSIMGYRALDVGHLAKCYSFYKEGKSKTADFFLT